MVIPATIPSAREQADEGVVRRERIPRWVGVVLPVAIVGGFGLVALYGVNRSWLPFVLFLAGSAALGLLTGFAARRSLPHRSNLLRWAVAMGALTVGLLAAGIVSGGEVGLGPLLPLVPRVRWGEMVQLASAGLAAWLAVRAFARPEMSSPHAPATEPGQANWGFIYHPTIHDTQPIRARRGARPSAALRASPSAQSIAPRPRADRPSAELTPPRRTQLGPREPVRRGETAETGAPSHRPSGRAFPLRQRYDRLVARLTRAVAWRPGRGFRLARRGPSPIRFTGSGEDRCPYCLDVVMENDRRGVTTCPVCHTRHHAECWAVTGTCQMPHLYEGRQATRTGAAR